MKKNVMTAKKWVEAGYTSKDKAMKMVKKYMAKMATTMAVDSLALVFIMILTQKIDWWMALSKVALQLKF